MTEDKFEEGVWTINWAKDFKNKNLRTGGIIWNFLSVADIKRRSGWGMWQDMIKHGAKNIFLKPKAYKKCKGLDWDGWECIMKAETEEMEAKGNW